MSDYEVDSTIPMDQEHMLDQSTGRFQSVKNGLPELIKNSKDQYSRLGVFDKRMRQIVAVISPDMRRLGVLDFAGAPASDFDGWRTWSSRTASRAHMAQDIEGAHGNGGKSFMVRGSARESSMCSSTNGRLTRMGFRNDIPGIKYRPVTYKNSEGHLIRNLADRDCEKALNSELEVFGISVEDLPEPAKSLFEERHSFTFVKIDGVKDWEGLREAIREVLVQKIPEDLASHAQAAMTIESCSVWVLRGSQQLCVGVLQVEDPEPYPGFPPRRISIPKYLVDPETSERISTGNGGPETKYLEIKSSAQNLRRTDRTKARNVLRFRNERNIVANHSIADLVPMATSGFLYGTLMLPALSSDQLAGIDRQYLAETPLVRATVSWASEQLKAVATEIQATQSNRDSPLDREAANDTLSQLRELMRRFLEPESETGKGQGPLPPKFGSVVQRIELEEETRVLKLPLGTTVPLIFKAYEIRGKDKLPVLRPDVDLLATQQGIVTLVGRASLKALREGECQIRLVHRSLDKAVRSNPIAVQVIDVTGIRLEQPSGLLKKGERKKLKIVANTRTQPADDLVYEATVDELEMGRINRSGWFTAGDVAGVATIRVKYGPEDGDCQTCIAQIGEESVERPPPKLGGVDIPYILLCGQPAPASRYGDLAEDQRTHPGGPFEPTIIDTEPQWADVVWINHLSKESEKARGRAPATGGQTSLRAQRFQQFLALKAFDVLKRLRLRQQVRDNPITRIEFLRELAQAETETADFLDAAYQLVDRMLRGSIE